MDKVYSHKDTEERLYKAWEEKGYFKPEVNPEGEPYSIILPPPNASGKMHTGNVLMIAIEDLLIRWKRMQGYAALWVPGTDHAGTETQITFEKELKKQGKSRFQYSRDELYKEIWDFVMSNKNSIEGQIRQMGASVDWSRYKFTLDESVIKTVYETFEKMHNDGLVYRGEYMVNYCPKCGTTYSDVEVSHKERKDSLYYIRYELVGEERSISIATVRPEPIWADTHLAVNPKDKKHKNLIGKKAINPLTMAEMEIIGDEFVDPKFGTGIVKLTPAVDKNDYEVAQKHKLPIVQVLDLNGKLLGRYEGLSVFEGRKKAVEELKKAIEKIETEYVHSVSVCKAGHDIEPTVLPNWFIKVNDAKKSFKSPALKAVEDGDVKIFPKWQENKYTSWMKEMHDWPISRQNVWGIRIPVWYKIDEHESRIWVVFIDNKKEIQQGPIRQHLDRGFTLKEIKDGLQRVVIPSYEGLNQPPIHMGEDSPSSGNWIRETDTFDTWFSSGQWPLVTLGYPDSADFKKFYPTSVMETGWEILRLWVSRMVMFGIYLTGKEPFENVYLHGRVMAPDGRKMSKSLGNVINPDEYIEQYGVDALRMGLVAGTANGKDFAFPKDKIVGYKHFANKIWNMARFILFMKEQYGKEIPEFESIKNNLTGEDKEIIDSLKKQIEKVNGFLSRFRFAEAAEYIYQFMWHEVADKYIESVKKREDKDVALAVLIHVYIVSLKLLHPFMPFVTEEIWQNLKRDTQFKDIGPSVMISAWPKY